MQFIDEVNLSKNEKWLKIQESTHQFSIVIMSDENSQIIAKGKNFNWNHLEMQ